MLIRDSKTGWVLALAVWIFWAQPAAGRIIHVDTDAPGPIRDGSSWTYAYLYLQDALSAAQYGDELWVAEGVYKPDRGFGIAPGDRAATFELRNGVTIKGGYAGFGAPDPNARDIEAYETILSGDLNGDDGPSFINNAENSYHVVSSNGTDTSAILDGFTIAAGNGNGSAPADRAGGMYNWLSYPTVTDCTFTANSAVYGGAMCNESASPTVTDCTFSGNRAAHGGALYNYDCTSELTNCTFSQNSTTQYGAGILNWNANPTLSNCSFSANSAMFGGGMYNYDRSRPTLANCMFSGNSARWDGGGMSNDFSDPVVTSCTFSGNWATDGGGMDNWSSHPMVNNCTFKGNFADNSGGGMKNYADSSPMVINCTFTGNSTADYGGGMATTRGGHPIVASCTFSGNSARRWSGGMDNVESDPVLFNCTFSGNWAGWSGGAMNNSWSSMTASNCVFIANTADFGGGIEHSDTRPSGPDSTLTNCVLWGNAAMGATQIDLWEECDRPLSIRYCNLQGGEAAIGLLEGYTYSTLPYHWGEGNIDEYPLLTPDGHLRFGSPCLDTGTLAGAPTTDRDVERRPHGISVDMGSDEFIDTDGDHLPDFWEQKYFGGPTAAEPNMDPDADGLTSLDEYELYSSDPNAPPYCVPSPFPTIQAAIDAAGDGDTVLVASGTYAGPGNFELDYGGKSVTVRSISGSASTTIDCASAGRAVNFEAVKHLFAVLEGFTITGGSADLGGGIRAEDSRFMYKDCVLIGNTATQAGGIYGWESSPTFDDVVIQDNYAGPNEPEGGLIKFSNINLQGNLTVEAGRLDVYSSWFDGPGCISIDQGASLRVMNDPCVDDTGPTAAGPTVIRTDVNGLGDIEIDAGQQLIVEGDAVVNLSGTSECNPDPNTGGHITVNGSLVVRGNATLINSDVDVKLLDIEGANDIQFNNITLLEASTGFGGEFFAGGTANIRCNTIVSEGDRYLDMDPDASSAERPIITQNQIKVIIKEGTLGSRGTLLELRAADYDCGGPNNPYCASGAYQVPASSPGFTDDPSENWVLEQLILDPNAKLNLTNRQGFEFQDFNDPNVHHWETVYIKEVVLGPNSVLNTALQTLYYQRLVDSYGVELLRDPNNPFAPLANGSRFEDIPLLGFSLGIIAMDDTAPRPHNEFDIRVRRRLTDPRDPNPLPPEEPIYQGLIERIDDDPNIPEGSGGVMDIRTQAPDKELASSVAAKGAFARAGHEDITVEFEYMFLEDPYGEAEMIVYLSDKPEVGRNLVEVARIRPPAPDRPGSVGSGQFAVFSGTFPRGKLNFTRGTYVELELRGTGARCWIDNWDPKIYCIICCDFDGYGYIDITDYLLLLAECGLPDPGGIGKGCLDLVTDGVVNTDDLLAWDVIGPLNACPWATGTSASSETETVPSETPSSILQAHGQSTGQSGPLLMLGKSTTGTGDFEPPDSYLYAVEAAGICTLNAPCSHNGRLVTDSYGHIHQIDGNRGLIRLDTGTVVVEPNIVEYEDSLVSIGFDDGAGLLLLDAAFRPGDPNTVYVVPVQVTPPPDEGCPYVAAAKLRLAEAGSYELLKLYGRNPAEYSVHTPTDCNVIADFVYEPDLQHLHEIEIDTYGNLFVLSSHWANKNNWVLIYDEATGNDSEVRVWLNDSSAGEPNLIGSTAMNVSSVNEKLYLTSSVNRQYDLTTEVYCFSIDRTGHNATGLDYDGCIDINCPEPTADICTTRPHLCDAGRFVSAITSIVENPEDGSLHVTGFTAPKLKETAQWSPFDPPDFFTTPMLAVIPLGANTADAIAISDCNLALPLSMVWTGATQECLKRTAPEYDDWVAWNTPDCWCYPRQCRGDTDGIKAGPFWVAIPDLNILRATINKNDAALTTIPNGICADFDHTKTGPFRAAIPDLNILRQYINKQESQVPVCDQPPIYTGPYNFWTSP